jgi:hypothetical protein
VVRECFEFEQRCHYCQGPKSDQFCGPSQGKHPEAAIEKDCDASQNDLGKMRDSPLIASPPWTSHEDEQLRALAPDETATAIAERLRRSVSATRHRARKLEIALRPARE